MPRITVADVPIVVLNWNGWDDTFECLARLSALGYEAQVWLVDNGSEEDRTAEVAARFPGVCVVCNGANLGWAGGNNVPLRQAAASGVGYVYLLNNDALPEDGFLEAICRDVPEDAGAIGSLVLDFEGRVRFDGKYRRRNQHFEGEAALRQVPQVNGSGMLISLAACRQVGFFDERYFCYGEESDWCRRAARAGLALYVHTGSIIRHRIAGSDVGDNKAYYMLRNHFIAWQDGERKPSEHHWFAKLKHEYEWCCKQHGKGSVQQKRTLKQALSDGLSGRFGPRDPAAGIGLRTRLGLMLISAEERLQRSKRWLRLRLVPTSE